MVHEFLQPEAFLQEIYTLFNPDGQFLVVEPVLRISRKHFKHTLFLAEAVEFIIVTRPKVKASYAVLLNKPN